MTTSIKLKQVLQITAISATFSVLGSSGQVLAGTLTDFTIYNTGEGVTAGTVDPNWNITSAPSASLLGSPMVFSTIPGVWLPNTADTQWIGPNNGASGTLGNDPVGNYVYQTAFDLTGYIPNTAILSFRAAVDNAITGVTVNGVSIGFTHNSLNTLSSVFTIDTSTFANIFANGVNTIAFTVRNDRGANPSQSPSGLFVDFVTAQAELVPIPEPSSLLGLSALAAFGMGSALKRHHKNQG